MLPRRLRLPAYAWPVAFGTPLVITLVLCLLMQPHPATLAAPLLGPWAGYLIGHGECTVATILPRRSFSMMLSGAILLVGRWREEDEVIGGALSLMLLLWLCVWCFFAVLSVLNTTS